MKKTFKIILSYLLITFNSNVFSAENNQANILKIGVLAPFSGEFKELGQTILYSVKQGDNLSKISKLFNVSIKTIRQDNDNLDIIRPGQILKITIKAF